MSDYEQKYVKHSSRYEILRIRFVDFKTFPRSIWILHLSVSARSPKQTLLVIFDKKNRKTSWYNSLAFLPSFIKPLWPFCFVDHCSRNKASKDNLYIVNKIHKQRKSQTLWYRSNNDKTKPKSSIVWGKLCLKLWNYKNCILTRLLMKQKTRQNVVFKNLTCVF